MPFQRRSYAFAPPIIDNNTEIRMIVTAITLLIYYITCTIASLFFVCHL